MVLGVVCGTGLSRAGLSDTGLCGAAVCYWAVWYYAVWRCNQRDVPLAPRSFAPRARSHQTSIASRNGGIGAPAYTISKHAALGLIRSASANLGVAGTGIRVNGIAPGSVATAIAQNNMEHTSSEYTSGAKSGLYLILSEVDWVLHLILSGVNRMLHSRLSGVYHMLHSRLSVGECVPHSISSGRNAYLNQYKKANTTR